MKFILMGLIDETNRHDFFFNLDAPHELFENSSGKEIVISSMSVRKSYLLLWLGVSSMIEMHFSNEDKSSNSVKPIHLIVSMEKKFVEMMISGSINNR